MENRINVAQYLRALNGPVFIKDKGPDKLEAAQRLTVTEKMFEEWHAAINRTHTSEMTTDLIVLYDEAAAALCRILMAEREIATRRD